jgi:hypothetical protein
MPAYILWANVDRVSMVRYVATVVAISQPDRPAEDALTACKVFATQGDAIQWSTETVSGLRQQLEARGDSIMRTEMMG